MSYSNKQLVRITLPSHDFGAGADIYSMYLPPREDGSQSKGKLVNVGIMAHTETFANDTGGGTVQVGTAADNDAYGLLNIPDAVADEACVDINTDSDVVISGAIPAGTLVEVNLTQCTDSGTAAGMAVPFIDVYVW